MDLNKALRELYEERERVDRAIHALESSHTVRSRATAGHRRGRKMMSPEERLDVSKRMTEYWRNRRAQKAMSPALESGIHISAREIAIA
jgi:hypothetical protein